MNNRQIITLIVVTVAGLVAGYFIGVNRGGIKSEGQISMKSQADSLNYFLGLNYGYSLQQAPWEINTELISSGLIQAVNENSEYDAMTANTVFQEIFTAFSQVETMEMEADAAENLENGIAFLEENGKREGVITTESGLQYEVITEGDGPVPADTSIVKVFYEGTLIDGTVFDGNYDTGDTAIFRVGGVIEGWTEALQLMSVGSTYKLYLPSNLAYGAMGAEPVIPGNSVLIFTVDLLGIE